MIHKRLVEEVKALAQDWKVVAAETSKGDAFDLKKQALLGRLLSLPEADLKDLVALTNVGRAQIIKDEDTTLASSSQMVAKWQKPECVKDLMAKAGVLIEYLDAANNFLS